MGARAHTDAFDVSGLSSSPSQSTCISRDGLIWHRSSLSRIAHAEVLSFRRSLAEVTPAIVTAAPGVPSRDLKTRIGKTYQPSSRNPAYLSMDWGRWNRGLADIAADHRGNACSQSSKLFSQNLGANGPRPAGQPSSYQCPADVRIRYAALGKTVSSGLKGTSSTPGILLAVGHRRVLSMVVRRCGVSAECGVETPQGKTVLETPRDVPLSHSKHGRFCDFLGTT